MTDFGAFVELAPGVDALLHVSQISRAHVEKPSDVLSVGQEITAKIVDLNEAEKKISLSMKALETTGRGIDEGDRRLITDKNRLDIYEKDSKDRDTKVPLSFCVVMPKC